LIFQLCSETQSSYSLSAGARLINTKDDVPQVLPLHNTSSCDQVNGMLNLEKLLQQIREKILYDPEKERLQNLHGHLEEREKQAHCDFLDCHQKHDDHQSRVEHHAANFWHYYYPGERPNSVIANEPVYDHQYGTEDQHRLAQERMIDHEMEKLDDNPLAMTSTPRQQHLMYDIMIGDMAMEKKNYADAERKYKDTLSDANKFGMPKAQVLKTLKKLMHSLSAQRKYSEFEHFFEQTLMLETDLPDESGHFPEEDALAHIATEYFEQGESDQAKELYEHALVVVEKLRGPNSSVVARCLNDLAGVYARCGEWQKSEELLSRALLITEKAPIEKSAEMAATLHNLGALYQHHNREDEAQELFGRAMALLERPGEVRS